MKTHHLIYVISLLILLSCSKDEPELQEVTFRINISSFLVETDDFSGHKSSLQDPFEDFTHKYTSGTISFTTSEGIVYSFSDDTLAGLSLTLPAGSYIVTGESGDPFSEGSGYMSFLIDEQTVVINESTTEINLTVKPTCALILVYDEFELVADAYMNDTENPFETEGMFYYLYFLPKTGWEAHVFKTDGAHLSLSVDSFLPVGHLVKVIVTNAGGDHDVVLTPVFTELDPISW